MQYPVYIGMLLMFLQIIGNWLWFFHITKTGTIYQYIPLKDIYEIIGRNKHAVYVRDFKTHAKCDAILFDDLFNHTGYNYKRLNEEELGLALLTNM